MKARKALDALAPLGLSVERLNLAAGHMTRAKRSLWDNARAWSNAHVRADGGDLILDREALKLDDTDAPARVLSAAFQWIGGATYRPRYQALVAAATAVAAGESRTLGGVMLTAEGEGARMSRELASVAPANAGVPNSHGIPWDSRWLVHVRPETGVPSPSPIPKGHWVAALGDHLPQVPNWRDLGQPRASLMATPAIFKEEGLVAAPAAGLSNGWAATLSPDFRTFLTAC